MEWSACTKVKWPKRALHIKEAQKHLKHSVDGKGSDRK